MTRPARLLLVAITAVQLVATTSCGAQSKRYSRKQAQTALTRLETPGLRIGEFALTSVTDGDTIRVEGLDSSLRLLALDAEETFKNEDDRRAVEADWEGYLARKRGASGRPVKMASPLGQEAKAFAKDFFAGVSVVRLERDDPKEIRDRYNRYLAYAFVEKDGRWFNYNVECVRAGMSPYFSKYGYSKRFHAEFVAAENEARAAKRGIWDQRKLAYRDYPERKAWWDARAEFVAAFEKEAAGKPDHIVLTHWDSLTQLEARLGQEVTILATVGDVRLGDRGPSRALLSRRMFSDFPLVFFDKDVFAATQIAKWRGEFVIARGVVTTYENKHTHKKQLQVVIDRPGQITLSQLPPENPQPEGAR